MSSDIVTLNKELYDLISKKDWSNPRIKAIIKQQKLNIYTAPRLNSQSEEFLSAARDFAEYNVFYSLASKDLTEFSRAIEKLKFFYENFRQLKQSNNFYQLEAIMLLYLLSFNNIEDFYTKLEEFGPDELSNKYIDYVINLNTNIEDGNYRMVFKLRDSCPIEMCEVFLERIQETLRVEVAKNSEKAYSSLTFKQAMEIFKLKSPEELKEFCLKASEKSEKSGDHIRWKIKDDRIHFDSLKKSKPIINSDELIVKMLKYADDIEKIV